MTMTTIMVLVTRLRRRLHWPSTETVPSTHAAVEKIALADDIAVAAVEVVTPVRVEAAVVVVEKIS